mmetsp:Transcript_74006/g.208920  ORF Transcript_74006/g.208920 Transcript_74006/m.208920 type:complete len:581 (-) Transcript_74006:305-2047(-)
MGFFKLVVAAAFVCVAISTAQVGARTFDAEEPGHPPRAIGRVIGRLLKKLLGRPVARALSRGNATRRSRRGSPQRKGLIVTPDVPIMAQDPESNSCWAYARASALFSTGALDKCMPLAFKAKYVYDFNYDALDSDVDLDDVWQIGVDEEELGKKIKKDRPSDWAMEMDIMNVAESIYAEAGRSSGSVVDTASPSFWPLEKVVESKGIATSYQWCQVYEAVRKHQPVTLALISKTTCDLKHFVTVVGMTSEDGTFPLTCNGQLKGIKFLANDPWCPDAVEAFTSQEDDLKYLGHCKTQKDSNLLLEREPDPNPQQGKLKLCTFAKGETTTSELSDHPCIPEITITTGPVDELHGDKNYKGWPDEDGELHYGCRDVNNGFATELRKRYEQKPKGQVLIAEGLLYNVQKKAIIWDIHAFQERSAAEERCGKALANRYKADTYIPEKKNENNKVQSKIATTQGDKEGREILLLDGKDLDKMDKAAREKEAKARRAANIEKKKMKIGEGQIEHKEYVPRKDQALPWLKAAKKKKLKRQVKKAVTYKLKTGSSLPAIHDSKKKSDGTSTPTKSKGNDVKLPKMKNS